MTRDETLSQDVGMESDRTIDGDASGAASTSGGTAHGGKYWRFAAMIATSMTAMFALTYSNTYRLGDVKWSETRFYMTFVMGAAMAVI
ncbi:MAG TPA: hypothetical protein VM282_26190, partial [Acidimicrobiales bacterium]|nr:hypothetical protein [Acidimicrobiales bacterium]